jgi:Mrp family chromosome partitioning ATPase
VPPPEPAPGLVPVFEELPVFEEEDLPPPHPDAIAQRLLGAATPATGAVKLLGSRVRALGRDRRLRRLGVTSASAGDGRSSVALGLAHTLAEGDRRRVLLVELDLSRPSLDRTFSLAPPETGLRRFLEGDGGDVVTVRRLSPETVWILSAGKGEPRLPEALSSPRLAALLKSADRVFDYAVLDCPPLLAEPEASEVQEHLDGTIFVVRARHTKRDAVREAARLLDRDRLCGYVLNGRRGRARS